MVEEGDGGTVEHLIVEHLNNVGGTVENLLVEQETI